MLVFVASSLVRFLHLKKKIFKRIPRYIFLENILCIMMFALKRSAAPLKMLKAGVCDAAAAGDVKVFKLLCARSIRDALREFKNMMFM